MSTEYTPPTWLPGPSKVTVEKMTTAWGDLATFVNALAARVDAFDGGGPDLTGFVSTATFNAHVAAGHPKMVKYGSAGLELKVFNATLSGAGTVTVTFTPALANAPILYQVTVVGVAGPASITSISSAQAVLNGPNGANVQLLVGYLP